MALIGNPRSKHQAWKFLVEIDGMSSSRWATCEGLSQEIAEISYFEGGDISPEKFAAKVTFGDVTLTRAASSDPQIAEWAAQCADALSNTGLIDDTYMRNGSIVQQNRAGETLVRYRLDFIWPKKYTPGKWDAKSDEFVMEELVLSIRRFVRVPVASL